MPVQLSPVLADLAQYPFARLDDWKAEARSRGIELIDFGIGDPHEVASVIHFLLSAQARYVTGVELVVDGGLRSTFMTPPRAR